jgi:hypothetical protein
MVTLHAIFSWCQIIIIFPKNLLAAVAEKMYDGDVTVVNIYKNRWLSRTELRT